MRVQERIADQIYTIVVVTVQIGVAPCGDVKWSSALQGRDGGQRPIVHDGPHPRIHFIEVTQVPNEGTHHRMTPVVIRQAALFREIAVVLRATVGSVVIQLDVFQSLRNSIEAFRADAVSHALLYADLKGAISS